MRLLLADDEKELTDALSMILNYNKFTTDCVYNGQDALDYAMSGEYDGIILDVMMPRMDGVEVLRRLRQAGITTPVLMLTAKSQLRDKVEGLDAGADDYLPKPFETEELLARIRAMARRGSAVFTPDTLIFGDLSLDRKSFELKCGGESVRLANKEFQMMELMMTNPKVVISTERFMDRVWGFDSDSEMNVVWAYVSYLRKKLQTLGSRVELTALRGRGYMLEDSGV
ncbi:MAG: response regulator transcription factor [Oscillospiraceae bacterium]|nr:response regulator transcription factor [Oscillospiraceae bacterium]HNX99843.1 response regulator transcription factor [Oscillospiraceae bacterium]